MNINNNKTLYSYKNDREQPQIKITYPTKQPPDIDHTTIFITNTTTNAWKLYTISTTQPQGKHKNKQDQNIKSIKKTCSTLLSLKSKIQKSIVNKTHWKYKTGKIQTIFSQNTQTQQSLTLT